LTLNVLSQHPESQSRREDMRNGYNPNSNCRFHFNASNGVSMLPMPKLRRTPRACEDGNKRQKAGKPSSHYRKVKAAVFIAMELFGEPWRV
jgi:hypothetical protein